MTTTTPPRLSPALQPKEKFPPGSEQPDWEPENPKTGKVSDLVGTPSIESFVDDLVEGIRALAAALVGKASHPEKDDTETDVDS